MISNVIELEIEWSDRMIGERWLAVAGATTANADRAH